MVKKNRMTPCPKCGQIIWSGDICTSCEDGFGSMGFKPYYNYDYGDWYVDADEQC